VEHITSKPDRFAEGVDDWDLAKARPNWGMDCALLTQTHVASIGSSAGGSLSLEGGIVVFHGRRLAVEMVPDSGYGLESITGCGGSVEGSRFVTGVVTEDCAIAASFGPFYLADNGVTVLCDQAALGDTGQVMGVVYTKRAKADIDADNAARTCTSGIEDFSGLFASQSSFNADIRHWDTSAATTMMSMFQQASSFNQDIGHWDTQQVTNMHYLFYQASAFDQDLSSWCVENVNDNSLMGSEDLPLFGQSCNP